MADKPEVISYWYAFDSNADKPYIKKEKGSGLLASFDCAEDAQRFCQWRQDVKYKEVQYVRLTDHEAARAADKARIAELVEALRAFTGAACPCAIQINPKGYSWSGAYLDEALKIAAPLLAQQGKENTDGQ